MFEGIDVDCCKGVYLNADNPCVCSIDERVLRAYSRSDILLETMTPEQRDWCLSEIESVEGYDRADYESSDDADLARGVLDAWQDYCRDKGLL